MSLFLIINNSSQSTLTHGFSLAGLQSKPINRDLPIKETHWFTSLAIKPELKTKLRTLREQGGFGVLGLARLSKTRG